MTKKRRPAGTVVVIGSLNADLMVRTETLPRPGQTVHGSALLITPGGKSANQAVAAALLGATVVMLGAVGDDDHGRMLRESLARAGVDTTGITTSTEPTGTAVIEVDASGENTIVISAGANGALAEDDIAPAAGLLDDAAVLCLCLEVPLATVTSAARLGHAHGAQVLLNLSPYAEVDAELLRLTDLLLVNEHEAAALIGRPADGDWPDVLAALREHGVDRTVITRGAAGAIVLDATVEETAEETVVEVPTVDVDAVDSTGSGDAFTGALACRLAAGDSLADAAVVAARAGAWAATGEGAQSSYASWDALQQWKD